MRAMTAATFHRWKSGSLADPSEPCGLGGRKCPMPPPMPGTGRGVVNLSSQGCGMRLMQWPTDGH